MLIPFHHLKRCMADGAGAETEKRPYACTLVNGCTRGVNHAGLCCVGRESDDDDFDDDFSDEESEEEGEKEGEKEGFPVRLPV